MPRWSYRLCKQYTDQEYSSVHESIWQLNLVQYLNTNTSSIQLEYQATIECIAQNISRVGAANCPTWLHTQWHGGSKQRKNSVCIKNPLFTWWRIMATFSNVFSVCSSPRNLNNQYPASLLCSLYRDRTAHLAKQVARAPSTFMFTMSSYTAISEPCPSPSPFPKIQSLFIKSFREPEFHQSHRSTSK